MDTLIPACQKYHNPYICCPTMAGNIITFSFFLLVCCCSATTTTTTRVPSTVSARAAFLQYWNLKLQTHQPPPEFFQAKIHGSSLTPLQLTPNVGSSSRVEKRADARPKPFIYNPASLMSSMGEVATTVDTDTSSPFFFFRESFLKKGTMMQMPDLSDYWTHLKFLPRSMASKIPFNADAINAIFHVPSGSAAAKSVVKNIVACNLPPNKGEKKSCMTSAEDEIDFAISALGTDNVMVRGTENSEGSMAKVLIGDVKPVVDGEVLTCHQAEFPYMLHQCHTVPRTKVYKVEIKDAETSKVINHAVAICHRDTSAWAANYPAFLDLGSAPGKIEVCHWIVQGDVIWTLADK